MDIRKRAILSAAKYLQKHKPQEFKIKLKGNKFNIYQKKMHLKETSRGVINVYTWSCIHTVSLLKDVEF